MRANRDGLAEIAVSSDNSRFWPIAVYFLGKDSSCQKGDRWSRVWQYLKRKRLHGGESELDEPAGETCPIHFRGKIRCRGRCSALVIGESTV